MLLPVIPNEGSCRPNSSLLRYIRCFMDIGLADLKRANPEIVLLVLNLQILFITSMVIIMGTPFTLNANPYDIMFA